MSDKPTVLVLGRRKTDNMPSLTRMLEVLRPRLDATVPTGSVRTAVQPMMGEGTATCPDCLGPLHSGPCPRPKR